MCSWVTAAPRQQYDWSDDGAVVRQRPQLRRIDRRDRHADASDGTAAVAASDVLSGAAPTNAIAASGTLTAAAGTAIVANNTATIGGTVYTFVTNVAGLTGAANQVVIGGSNGQALTNLAAAINNTSGGAGTEFGGVTAANAFATAAVTTAGNSGVITVTANINGVGNASTTGNSVGLVASTGLTAGATTLLNGSAGSTVAIGGKTYTFVAALSNLPTANEVLGGVRQRLEWKAQPWRTWYSQ